MNLADITEATEAKLSPSIEKTDTAITIQAQSPLGTLRDHYTARHAAMKLAFGALAPLDDDARAAVFQALSEGSAAGILTNMGTFKQRLAKLLGVSLNDAATVK